MVAEPITYIGLHLGPNSGANDAVIGVRVVPDRKVGNVVYARTLNAGEPDTDEAITLSAGEKLVCPPGSVRVTIHDVDRYAKLESDGYAAVTNTVWTWLQIPPSPGETFFNYLLAVSRRLDMAHALCLGTLSELGERPDEPFIRTRERIFGALGNAELMCISLNRAIEMIRKTQTHFREVKTAVPEEVECLKEPVWAIRNAFEHIDERAMGRTRWEDEGDAASIFDQGDLVSYGVLRYDDHALNLRTDVIPTLIAGRKFIYDVITEAGTAKTVNQAIEFRPVSENGEAATQ